MSPWARLDTLADTALTWDGTDQWETATVTGSTTRSTTRYHDLDGRALWEAYDETASDIPTNRGDAILRLWHGQTPLVELGGGAWADRGAGSDVAWTGDAATLTMGRDGARPLRPRLFSGICERCVDAFSKTFVRAS